MATAGSAPERFQQLLGQFPPELAAPELLPSRWARAAADSLGVDGAGLSMHDPDRLRTPLSSSSDEPRWPSGCSSPSATARASACTTPARRSPSSRPTSSASRPQLHDSLVAGTPFRAVLSTPLLPPIGPTLVLDLYVREPDAVQALDRDAVEEVTVALTREVVRAVVGSGRGEEVPWWRGPEARGRTRVWEAMGLLSVQLEQTQADALDVLRAHALATGRVVEEVADDVVSGRLPARELDPAG